MPFKDSFLQACYQQIDKIFAEVPEKEVPQFCAEVDFVLVNKCNQHYLMQQDAKELELFVGPQSKLYENLFEKYSSNESLDTLRRQEEKQKLSQELQILLTDHIRKKMSEKLASSTKAKLPELSDDQEYARIQIELKKYIDSKDITVEWAEPLEGDHHRKCMLQVKGTKPAPIDVKLVILMARLWKLGFKTMCSYQGDLGKGELANIGFDNLEGGVRFLKTVEKLSDKSFKNAGFFSFTIITFFGFFQSLGVYDVPLEGEVSEYNFLYGSKNEKPKISIENRKNLYSEMENFSIVINFNPLFIQPLENIFAKALAADYKLIPDIANKNVISLYDNIFTIVLGLDSTNLLRSFIEEIYLNSERFFTDNLQTFAEELREFRALVQKAELCYGTADLNGKIVCRIDFNGLAPKTLAVLQDIYKHFSKEKGLLELGSLPVPSASSSSSSSSSSVLSSMSVITARTTDTAAISGSSQSQTVILQPSKVIAKATQQTESKLTSGDTDEETERSPNHAQAPCSRI